MKVADYFIEQLAAWGVKRVYGVIGDAILPLMDALSRRQGQLQFVQVRQEAAAGFMASAEAKLTGVPAVCIGTSGPGLANLINGLGDAYADRVPLLAITGQVESYKVGTESKQEVNQQAMVQALAGYTALLAGPGAAPKVLVRALKTAVSEGRVVQISVPKDYWDADLPGAEKALRPPEPFLTAPPVPSDETVRAAAALLRGARRPVILAGHGARPAAAELMALAETLQAGIVLALGGKGLAPGAHRQVLGGVGQGGSPASHRALHECDAVAVVGSTWWPAGYMPQQATVIQIDRCPANIGAQTAVDFGLPGDSRTILPALTAHLRADPGQSRSDWLATLDGYKREAEAQLAGEGAANGERVHPAAIVRALEPLAPPGSIITLDTGDHLLWFNRHFRGDGQRVLFSGTWRTMGFALPAASAAKLVEPGARVMALVGDGGLTMQLGELAVPVQHGLDLTVVVADNGALALEANRATSEGYQPYGHQLNNPDFAAVARAFGWKAWRVDRQADLAQALTEAVATPGPTLVNVLTLNDASLHTRGA